MLNFVQVDQPTRARRRWKVTYLKRPHSGIERKPLGYRRKTPLFPGVLVVPSPHCLGMRYRKPNHLPGTRFPSTVGIKY